MRLVGGTGLRRRLQPTTQKGLASSDRVAAGGLLHGHHVAVSMALGFLFLGAGQLTFSTSNEAVAALVISLFPVFPQHPGDHRCHLQVCTGSHLTLVRYVGN